ncbi:MAG: F0F1 ATP synthase subunit epsilon [Candidatus Methylomirabilia bacterium]
MADLSLRFELATPTRLVVSEDVDEVVAPGAEGHFGVWPGHAPFLTMLGSGEVVFRRDHEERCLAVNGGFAEVGGDRVILLVDAAERPEEIDRERARRALERAERRLGGRTQEEIDYTRALAAMRRALTRLQVAAHSKPA